MEINKKDLKRIIIEEISLLEYSGMHTLNKDYTRTAASPASIAKSLKMKIDIETAEKYGALEKIIYHIMQQEMVPEDKTEEWKEKIYDYLQNDK